MILGILLYCTPFVAVFLFKDIKKGFLAVFVASVGFDLLAALVLQFFGAFSYSTVISVRSVAAVFAFFVIWQNRKSLIFPKIKLKSVASLFLILASLLISIELFSIHYFYTGLVTAIDGFEAAKMQSFKYPYVSDEWNGVALANYSIRTGNLPLVNPMDEDKPFLNPLVGFFSFSSFLFALFNFDPLTQYRLITVIFGLLTCLFLYLYTREVEKGQFAALVGVMSIPLIANSGNLNGIWAYLPFTVSFLLLVCALFAYRLKSKIITLAAAFLAIVLYPPTIILAAAFFLGIFTIEKGDKKWYKGTFSIIAAGIFLLSAIVILKIGFSQFTWYLGQTIIRDNLTDGIPSFPIWKIVSIPIILLGLVGSIKLIKERKFEIIFPLAISGAFWVLYAFSETIFVIDYPRVVMITAMLLSVPAAAGYEIVTSLLERKDHIKARWIHIGVLIAFFSFLISYPSSSWSEFVLKSPEGEVVAHPAAPVTNYLKEEDLQLFEGIHEKWFIAPPWKGLVIGSATHNYPLESKDATISNRIYPYRLFMEHSCEKKREVAKKYNVSYVYTPQIFCAGFKEVGASSERLYLYKVE